jgi:16S rRNA (guanine527-N7)-methyltransferase
MTSPEGGPATEAELPDQVRAAAEAVFGGRLEIAQRYARSLATDGVVRGLVGPREAPRVWDRHLLNCAVVAELIPPSASVTDVGSGAGLPGLALAIARPGLTVTLVEAKERAAGYLTEVVGRLGLGERVTVVRARAEECAGRLGLADVVTARALAPLDQLAAWCLPLTVVGGRVLALKGSSVEDEVAAHAPAVRRLGGTTPAVRRCGVGVVPEPTTVVEIVRERVGSSRRGGSRSRRG